MDVKSKRSGRQRPFFVYGTLLPGQPNQRLWQGNEASVAAAKLANGRLFDMGGYPMLVEGGDEPVPGAVITARPEGYHRIMGRLDALEGYDPARPDAPGYRRVVREVVLANGRSLAAWVYVGQPELIDGRPQVANGDWAAYVTANKNRIQEWRSTADIVYGLHRFDLD